MPVLLVCSWCTAPYFKPPSEAANSKYCSRKCQNMVVNRRNGKARTAKAILRQLVDKQPEDYRIFKLIDGQVVKVNIEDYDLALNMPWHLNNKGYVYTRVGGRKVALHRMILERVLGRPLVHDEMVDHSKGDPLDNRRFKIRLATRAQNNVNKIMRTTSGNNFKGVHNDKRNPFRPWLMRITLHGVTTHVGYFTTEQEAAYIYDQFALQLFGEFARTNFEY